MKKTYIILGLIIVIALGALFFKEKNTNNVPITTTGTNTTNTGSVLDLSNQGLAKVPESVFNRTDIVELNLSGNVLTGALPSQVGQLKNLKILNLSSNKFTGVPAEVGQLKDLEVLNLSNNQLTGLPNEIGNLSKLKLLNISGNNYSQQDLAGIRSHLPATTVIKTN